MKEKVFFSVITESQSYTNEYTNSRENFDKFMDHLLSFLKRNRMGFSLHESEGSLINTIHWVRFPKNVFYPHAPVAHSLQAYKDKKTPSPILQQTDPFSSTQVFYSAS